MLASLGDGIGEEDLLVHDECASDPTLAFALARMRHPAYPEPFGVLRSVDRPVYETLAREQIEDAHAAMPEPSLAKLYASGDTWEVT